MPQGGGNDDNRANQMNPNNDAYHQSRGEDGRPEHSYEDWDDDDEDDWEETPSENVQPEPAEPKK